MSWITDCAVWDEILTEIPGAEILTESFNKADGTLGPDQVWNHLDLGLSGIPLEVVSNTAAQVGTNSDTGYMLCDTALSSSDHYVEITVTENADNGFDRFSCLVRWSTASGFRCQYSTGATGPWEIRRFSGLSTSSIVASGSSGNPLLDGDVLRAEVIGSVLTFYKNGVSIGSYGSADFTSQFLVGFGIDGIPGRVDDWEAGVL